MSFAFHFDTFRVVNMAVDAKQSGMLAWRIAEWVLAQVVRINSLVDNAGDSYPIATKPPHN